MNKWQRNVRAFHEATNSTVGRTIELRDRELRADLIWEEAKETADAILRGDMVEAIDGLCDLIYVSLGAAVAWGVDLDGYWEEVHESNLSKTLGGIRYRPDGKVMKGPNFHPPRIRELLESQQWEEATSEPAPQGWEGLPAA